MKRTLTCPKCAGRDIAYRRWVPDAKRSAAVQRSVGERVRPPTGLFEVGEVVGAYLEAYVCVACGYLEEHVRDPETVPWEELGFTLLRRQDGPGA